MRSNFLKTKSMSGLERDSFDKPVDIETYGIKYAGSKQKLIPYILNEVFKFKPTTVIDAFSGTTRVSQALAKSGIKCVSNDISEWSQVFARAFLLPRDENEVKEVITHLNTVQPYCGWFTEHYGGELSEHKKVWQNKNAKKLDAIRDEIDKLDLSDITKSVALASLLLALDKVDSTLGHFTSYLKDWSARSHKDLRLDVPEYMGENLDHVVTKLDVLSDEFGDLNADLAYMDPPYGSNNEQMPSSRIRYASYYHLWTTIIKHDKPDIFGAAGRREDSRDALAVTEFEEFRKNNKDRFIAIDAIEKSIKNVDAEYVLLSYSSGGRATAADLTELLEGIGRICNIASIDHKRHIMASMSWTKDWISDSQEGHKEYLFTLQK